MCLVPNCVCLPGYQVPNRHNDKVLKYFRSLHSTVRTLVSDYRYVRIKNMELSTTDIWTILQEYMQQCRPTFQVCGVKKWLFIHFLLFHFFHFLLFHFFLFFLFFRYFFHFLLLCCSCLFLSGQKRRREMVKSKGASRNERKWVKKEKILL